MKIDHHIQQTILKKLSLSEEPISYTSLKQPGIENSLFSYHLNKLTNRSMINKNDSLYSLTNEGARWLHNNGFNLQPKEAARVFIGALICNNRGEYLIGQREGQFKSQINDYMLPSMYYQNDSDISNQIDELVQKFVPEDKLVRQVEYGFGQYKAIYFDKTIRLLMSVTVCHVESYESPFESWKWMSLEQITAITHPSIGILLAVIEHVSDQGNIHPTPLFIGNK